jgi:hypothetical protein
LLLNLYRFRNGCEEKFSILVISSGRTGIFQMKKGPFGIYGGFGGAYLIILAAGTGSFLFF